MKFDYKLKCDKCSAKVGGNMRIWSFQQKGKMKALCLKHLGSADAGGGYKAPK